jgi:serine/threonine-protein kinase BUR1
MNRHSRDPEDRPRRGSRDSANSQDRYVDERAERNRGYRDRDGPPPRDGRDYGRDRRTRSRSPDRRDRGQHNIYRR